MKILTLTESPRFAPPIPLPLPNPRPPPPPAPLPPPPAPIGGTWLVALSIAGVIGFVVAESAFLGLLIKKETAAPRGLLSASQIPITLHSKPSAGLYCACTASAAGNTVIFFTGVFVVLAASLRKGRISSRIHRARPNVAIAKSASRS